MSYEKRFIEERRRADVLSALDEVTRDITLRARLASRCGRAQADDAVPGESVNRASGAMRDDLESGAWVKYIQGEEVDTQALRRTLRERANIDFLVWVVLQELRLDLLRYAGTSSDHQISDEGLDNAVDSFATRDLPRNVSKYMDGCHVKRRLLRSHLSRRAQDRTKDLRKKDRRLTRLFREDGSEVVENRNRDSGEAVLDRLWAEAEFRAATVKSRMTRQHRLGMFGLCASELGYSTEEIAALLAITPGALRVYTCRARRLFRKEDAAA